MKTYIVTGGTKGIGQAIVKRLSEGGANCVVAGGRNLSDCEDSEFVRYVAMDVRERSGHKKLLDAALSWRNQVDGYVNCAGISIWRPLAEIDEEFLNMMLGTNLQGAFWGSQIAADYFGAAGVRGSIVNISSLAGKRGSANNSAYCAAKFGLNGLTQSLAKELGPKQIRVNAVCPVYVETDAILNVLKDERSPASGTDVRQYLDSFALAQAALQRLPTKLEVAELVYFLLSCKSSAITGQCINIDCGVLPQ